MLECPFKVRCFASAARGEFDVRKVCSDLHFSTKLWVGVSISQQQELGTLLESFKSAPIRGSGVEKSFDPTQSVRTKYQLQ